VSRPLGLQHSLQRSTYLYNLVANTRSITPNNEPTYIHTYIRAIHIPRLLHNRTNTRMAQHGEKTDNSINSLLSCRVDFDLAFMAHDEAISPSLSLPHIHIRSVTATLMTKVLIHSVSFPHRGCGRVTDNHGIHSFIHPTNTHQHSLIKSHIYVFTW
jgi:hypothetical protein